MEPAEALEKIALQIDIQKAKFDMKLIEEDLSSFNLCEASTTILKGGLATIKALIECRERIEARK